MILSFPDREFLKVRRADAAEAPGRRRMVCPSCLRLVNVQRGVIIGHSIGGAKLCAASWLSRWSPDLRAVRAPGPLVALGANFP